MKKRVWTVMPVYIIFVVLLIGMSLISYRYSKILFLIEIGISLIALAVVLIMTLSFRSYVKSVVHDTAQGISNMSPRYLEQIKLPCALVGESDEIILYNSKFKKLFFDTKEPTNESVLPCVVPYVPSEIATTDGCDIEIKDRKFTVYATKGQKGILLYFVDNTYFKNTAKEFEDSRKSVAFVVFDNYEDFVNDSEEEAAQVMLSVESLLQRWASKHNSLFRKLSDNRYIIIFDERVLARQTETKFRILDKVRQITFNGRSATVSIGVGRNTNNLRESQTSAKKALDMALGRGGDQVAVYSQGEYEFFGGVSKGVEKTNKVRVRVISESVKNALESCDKVLIMGHRFSDLDCIGAAIGIYSTITKTYHKSAHIIADVDKSMAKPMIEHMSSENKDMFISPDMALLHANSKTLLFIVDTHSPDFIESDKVYKACGRTIVIDHHRKMVNYIDNASVFFHEPTASSTCEMVTELINYLGDDNLTHSEAEALLAGIMLDTKNFIIKTGVRTFEAAAYLRKKGADTVTVRDLFANSIETYKEKYRLVSEAHIVNHCAIAVADGVFKNSRLICAQAADDLLQIKGVFASFVISQIDNRTVNISARSFGKINVQIIMEKLGGGGHQTMAAAQLADTTILKARELLIETLNSQEVI